MPFHVLHPCILMAFAALPDAQSALHMAFPNAQITRKEHVLTEPQASRVQSLAGVTLSGRWVVAYEARKNGAWQGVAFFDSHRVRTLQETTMVAIQADGSINRVEVVAFREPMDYFPKEAWLGQFQGHRLDADLSLKKRIRPLAGATLTAQALTDASRRSLALFQVLYTPAK